MTNGDKLQQVLNVDNDCVDVWGEDGKMFFSVTQEWWNSESDDNKGEWVECHPLQPDDTAYMCSKCHSGDYGCERYDFCPWCGADMRGKAE